MIIQVNDPLRGFNDKQRGVMMNTESHEVSSRYNVINTMDVVQRFERFGFELSSIDAANVRTIERQNKGKHMVRMRADFKMAGGLVPEVIINNSYDGTKALNIRIGIFRFVCSNGLIAGHNLVPNLQVMHHNGSWGNEINNFIDTYETKHRLQQEWVNEMQDRQMTLDEAYYMAEQALKIRHSDKRLSNEAVDPLELLLVKRREDKGDSAWLRFNVLQEHLVNGEYNKYMNDGSIGKAKILTSVDELVRFNVGLSDMFSEQIKIIV